MTSFQLTIKHTTHPEIIKFESNRFLTDHNSREYNNIDEAKDSPLAQQLFFLPFVKAVYITPSFVAVARYPMVTWEEVQDELLTQIEDYLNEGGMVIESAEKAKATPITVYAENTPNPAAMRYVANKILVAGLREFKSAETAESNTLVAKLFAFPYVKEVFVSDNYLSVTKHESADWDEITQEVRQFILDELTAGTQAVLNGQGEKASSASSEDSHAESDDVISAEIKRILDEYVKPAVASDGGHIRFEAYSPNTKTVTVTLQGACSGCPSSIYTLKNGIENMFRQMMGEHVQHIEAVNG
ncbi:MAG: hypothetical protein CO119_03105 [Flavobacteriales bacterium CG_4_9_14_3_um_filter_40_17]|nr:MAG: hypothetical protein CO119_03105 [Flavobacteriales bacterium CG_4_9_14_3_um_filter_40_17]